MKPARISNAIVLSFLVLPAAARAQETRFVVEPQTSLAWWQIDPHYGHLWATTCPEDPSWQPGDARSFGGSVNKKTRKATVASHHPDARVPLYPRDTVKPVCRRAVAGAVLAGDTTSWSSVKGEITIMPDSLSTGMEMRDSFSRKAVFEVPKYRHIRFNIDRLENVQPGDTIRAVAVGTLELHGVKKEMKAPVKAWREAGGLRVQTQFNFPADDLTRVYNFSKFALGMGVTLGRWQTVHMGVDVLLKKS